MIEFVYIHERNPVADCSCSHSTMRESSFLSFDPWPDMSGDVVALEVKILDDVFDFVITVVVVDEPFLYTEP